MVLLSCVVDCFAATSDRVASALGREVGVVGVGNELAGDVAAQWGAVLVAEVGHAPSLCFVMADAAMRAITASGFVG